MAFNKRRGKARQRRGLTLAELLIASTIMLLIATAVASLAATVQTTNDYCKGHTVAAQHARVALSRIERAAQNAVANEHFPGCLVVTEQAGSQALPSTLVAWNPTTSTVANPAGLPLVSEIVVFTADPAHPNHLIEIRSPTDAAVVPAASDISAWRTLTDSLKTSNTTTKIILTDRMRTSPLTGAYRDTLSPVDLRGAVRFRCLMAPSATEWGQYRAGTRTWQNIAWPMDSYRSTSGTRAVACQTELQIAPGSMSTAAVTAIPFYGSASISYELPR